MADKKHTCDDAQREQELSLEIESLKGAMQVLSEGYDRITAERDAALAAQPPAASVETDDVTAALNARQADINESMARPSSSAATGDAEQARRERRLKDGQKRPDQNNSDGYPDDTPAQPQTLSELGELSPDEIAVVKDFRVSYERMRAYTLSRPLPLRDGGDK